MKIQFVSKRPARPGALAVLVSQAEAPQGAAAALDRVTAGQVRRAYRSARFAGRSGESCEILAPHGVDASRLLLIGAGDLSSTGEAEFERIGGVLGAQLLKSGDPRLAVDTSGLDGGRVDPARAAACVAFGLRLRTHRFDRYRTETQRGGAPRAQIAVVITPSAKKAVAEFAKLEMLAEGIVLARELVSEPGNVLVPKSFAKRIRELTRHGVRVQVLGEKELKRLGFGALLGVSQGSVQEPQVVICEYDGTRGKTSAAPVVLAGKGVTFDSGGISIKPSAGMESMHQDMGGAASVIGAIKTLALRKANCHVVGICGLVENMPSGTAQRPGDVVTSLSGKTIEVINTDAEGRLVLCDLLWYAQQRFRPKVIVDMATLTGAIVVALGQEYAGLFCNDTALSAQLIGAGAATGDRLWQFPMGPAYDKLLASQVADMKNVGPSEGRSIIAAQFIQRFVQEGVAWAHVDFGGMVWSAEDTALSEKGATGFGVRLLERFIAENHEKR